MYIAYVSHIQYYLPETGETNQRILYSLYEKLINSGMRLLELASPPVLYHGSSADLAAGKVYRARERDLKTWDTNTSPEVEAFMEKTRPKNAIPRNRALYMVGKKAHIQRAGGSDEHIYVVQPVNRVERHDVEWLDDLANLFNNLQSKPIPGMTYRTYNAWMPPVKVGKEKEAMLECAKNYWEGMQHPHKKWSVWEYMTPSFRIVEQVK